MKSDFDFSDLARQWAMQLHTLWLATSAVREEMEAEAEEYEIQRSVLDAADNCIAARDALLAAVELRRVK